MPDTPEHNDLRQLLGLLYEPGDVFEIRAPKCRERRGATFVSTASGYYTFDAIDEAAAAITDLDDGGMAPGIYVTLNPVRADLLARSVNRLRTKAMETTADQDIPRRRWLLVDIDPDRPSGVSATDGEVEAANRCAEAIGGHLAGQGWPEPIVAMSGNGYHLLYRVDLPGDDNGLVRRVLDVLASRFAGVVAGVSIDRSVFNPARIVKVVGTMARKGDDLRDVPGIEGRPHRRSHLVHVPKTMTAVTTAQLEAVADNAAPPAPIATNVADATFPATAAGVKTWLQSHGVVVKGERTSGAKTMLLLERCPVNPEIISTNGSDIAVLVGDDGKLAYCNQHNRGQGFTWHDLRSAVDAEYANRLSQDPDVDLSALLAPSVHVVEDDEPDEAEQAIAHDDPGPLPSELLRVPGFINEVMDHCLATAPYPNPVMAFCGALTLQAFLAGRKVRDAANNRTNLYVLALANSGSGKDHPRRINTEILSHANLVDAIGDGLASGEGIEDALVVQPAKLFQTDEIDELIGAIHRARDGRNDRIMSILLKMYSSAASIYPVRVKASKEAPATIDQPSLCLLGTAVPMHYYEAMSLKMLSNGFFARMIVFEAGVRGRGQEVVLRPLPPRVLDTARWWSEFQPGQRGGNLTKWHPEPVVVEASSDAKEILREFRSRADDAYGEAEASDDGVGMATWARAGEKAMRLALIYACSEDRYELLIQGAAAQWATALIEHQTRRMLHQASAHVSETDFHARCKRLVGILREWRSRKGDVWMPFWQLSRKLPWTDREHEEIRTALLNQRGIEYTERRTGGTPKRLYRAT